MKLIYYQNLEPNYFLSELGFNFSHEYEIILKSTVNNIESDEEIEYIEVDLEIKKNEDKYDIYSELPFISDVSIIVGQNGIGKSTIIQLIKSFLSESVLKYSHEILITKSFVLIGDKIRLSQKSIDSLNRCLPNHLIFLSSSNYKEHDLQNVKKKELERNTSLIQTNDNLLVGYYTNEVDPSSFNINGNSLYSSSEINEEPIKLIDLSTSDQIVKSNKWGIKSEKLKESLSPNNLASYEDYELRLILEQISDDNELWKLIPDTIKSKMQIKISVSGLPSEVINYCFREIGFEKIYDEYPKFHTLTEAFNSDWYTNFTKDLIISLIFIAFDNYALQNESVDKKNSVFIEEIIIDFETSVQSAAIVYNSKGKYKNNFLKELFELYTENSIFLKDVPYSDRIIEGINFFLSETINDKELNDFRLMGSGLFGWPFRVQEDMELLFKAKKLIGSLEGISSFQIPFFRFSALKISSGERNYLQLIMRLGSALKISLQVLKDKEVSDNFHALVLLDEPINAFHPEWQLQFISRMFEFFKNIHTEFENAKFQLVVSSHSPFLLSNVTNDHVIKLRRDGLNTVIESDADDSQTFGANVYDLLNDSFFLENGFIGEFARDKIDGCFRDLELNKNISQEREKEIQKIIKLVGDPLIKRELVRAYDMKFKTDLQTEFIDEQMAKLQELKNEIARRKND